MRFHGYMIFGQNHVFVGRLVKHGANDLSKKKSTAPCSVWGHGRMVLVAQPPTSPATFAWGRKGNSRVAVWSWGFSINGGTPIAGWFARDNPMKFHEHPMKMHDLGVFLV